MKTGLFLTPAHPHIDRVDVAIRYITGTSKSFFVSDSMTRRNSLLLMKSCLPFVSEFQSAK